MLYFLKLSNEVSLCCQIELEIKIVVKTKGLCSSDAIFSVRFGKNNKNGKSKSFSCRQ
jgi:hypothetical protein